jgi:hypothetical protein
VNVRSVINTGIRLVTQTMLDSVYLRDRTKTKDSTGGVNETWVERAQPVKCRVVRLKDDDPEIALDSVYGRPSAVLLLPLGTAYKEGDRARSTKDQSIWVITNVLTPPSDVTTVNRAGIREL